MLCKEVVVKAKHLVLDPEVYELLALRKKATGLTMKELGNLVLRASLGLPSPWENALHALVRSGKLKPEDYDEALNLVLEEMNAQVIRVDELGASGHQSEGSLGSWAGRELARAPDGRWQVMEAWGQDNRRAFTLPHLYRHVEAVGLLVSGQLALRCPTGIEIFEAPHFFHFPKGHVCASAPLSTETRVVLIFFPALDQIPATKPSTKPRRLCQAT